LIIIDSAKLFVKYYNLHKKRYKLIIFKMARTKQTARKSVAQKCLKRSNPIQKFFLKNKPSKNSAPGLI
jgi:hypothetical protein